MQVWRERSFSIPSTPMQYIIYMSQRMTSKMSGHTAAMVWCTEMTNILFTCLAIISGVEKSLILNVVDLQD